MSRIGKMPIEIPNGVTAEISADHIKVSGNLGTLELDFDKRISVKQEGNKILVTRSSDEREDRSKHGLYRTLINNMMIGVSKGYKKNVIINGIGYKATKQAGKLILNVGYSKPVEFIEPEGITLNVVEANKIEVSGINKEIVGQVASKLRAIKPVEPYHLYGIRYEDEIVVKKEGKKAAKK